MSSSSSGDASSMDTHRPEPALFTSTSTERPSARTDSASRPTASGSPTSHAYTCARIPSSAASAFSLVSPRATSRTVAPRACAARATASPIPLDAPVIRTVRPTSFMRSPSVVGVLMVPAGRAGGPLPQLACPDALHLAHDLRHDAARRRHDPQLPRGEQAVVDGDVVCQQPVPELPLVDTPDAHRLTGRGQAGVRPVL